MNQTPLCGPERDPGFFEDLAGVFAKHPDAAGRYSIGCMRRETEVMKIDFNKQVGLSRIEGDRMITEYRDRSNADVPGESLPNGPFCCQWVLLGNHFHCTVKCWMPPD